MLIAGGTAAGCSGEDPGVGCSPGPGLGQFGVPRHARSVRPGSSRHGPSPLRRRGRHRLVPRAQRSPTHGARDRGRPAARGYSASPSLAPRRAGRALSANSQRVWRHWTGIPLVLTGAPAGPRCPPAAPRTRPVSPRAAWSPESMTASSQWELPRGRDPLARTGDTISLTVQDSAGGTHTVQVTLQGVTVKAGK